MTKEATTIIGKWRITRMSAWNRDYIDLVEPGFITFEKHGMGEMAFGVVTAALDCAFNAGKTDVSFEFIGSDEGDEISGEGTAELTGANTIKGEIEFHNGDDTTFEAHRW